MRIMQNMTDILKKYKTIEGHRQSQFEEEKSIFITNAKYVESEDEAISFIEEIRQEHKQATHNCYAYIINTLPETKRYSDDGEPQGSAGLPMLSVLEKEEVRNLAVVVTRYFGGKLLGKGGLVRAYSRGVSDTISTNVVCKREYFEVELTHSYALLGLLENYLNENKFKIIDKTFTDEVTVKLYVRSDDYEKLENDLINLTSANIKIHKLNTLMLFEK